MQSGEYERWKQPVVNRLHARCVAEAQCQAMMNGSPHLATLTRLELQRPDANPALGAMHRDAQRGVKVSSREHEDRPPESREPARPDHPFWTEAFDRNARPDDQGDDGDRRRIGSASQGASRSTRRPASPVDSVTIRACRYGPGRRAGWSFPGSLDSVERRGIDHHHSEDEEGDNQKSDDLTCPHGGNIGRRHSCGRLFATSSGSHIHPFFREMIM